MNIQTYLILYFLDEKYLVVRYKDCFYSQTSYLDINTILDKINTSKNVTCIGKFCAMCVNVCRTSSLGAESILWAACMLSSWNCQTLRGASWSLVSVISCPSFSNLSFLSGYNCLWMKLKYHLCYSLIKPSILTSMWFERQNEFVAVCVEVQF